MPIYKMSGKKNGLQQYRVRINYTDSNGKGRQIDRVAYGKDEAKLLEIRLQQELCRDGMSATMTVTELFADYMNAKRHEVRETTFDKSNRILKRYILPYVGEAKITKLTAPVLQKWKSEISSLGLAIKTRQNIFREFKAMLNYAVRVEYLPRNPLSVVGNFKDAYDTPMRDKLHYYTPAEFKRYISCARASATTLNDWGYYVFFNIAFYTGMRKGEIHALKWSDIEGDFIHVRRSIAQKLKGEDRETPPKNKSSYRTLQMPKPLIDVLREHRERHRKCTGFSEDWRVCGGIACLRDTSIENKNKQFCKEAGLPHIRIHDFRHSHASVLANAGINIQEIARRLGHSKVETTWNTYAHLYPKEEERAVEILNMIV